MKAEAAIGEHGASPRTEKAQLGGSTQAVNEEKSKHATFPSKLEREEGAHAGHIKQTGSSDGDGHSKRARNQFIAKIGGDKSGEKRRRQRRPDPFKEAKVTRIQCHTCITSDNFTVMVGSNAVCLITAVFLYFMRGILNSWY